MKFFENFENREDTTNFFVFLFFFHFFQNFKGKKQKNEKKWKNFLRDRPARWRARRTNQFPDAISGGFFPSFTYARNCIFCVGPASDRRRRGVGQASDRFPPNLKKIDFSKFSQILKEKSEKNEKKAKNFLRDRPARWRARRTNQFPDAISGGFFPSKKTG